VVRGRQILVIRSVLRVHLIRYLSRGGLIFTICIFSKDYLNGSCADFLISRNVLSFASVSVLQSAAVGGSVVGVVGPL